MNASLVCQTLGAETKVHRISSPQKDSFQSHPERMQNLGKRQGRRLTPVSGRTTLLAEAEECGIGVLRGPVFLLAAPLLPLGFERVNIPPGCEGLGFVVGDGPQMHVKEAQLLFVILESGIDGLPLLGL